MIKYLTLALMIAAPVSSLALTPDQEITQKCDIKMTNRSKALNGKSIFQDKRICACVAEDIKKQADTKKFQDIADFYSEKYDGVNYNDIKNDPKAIYIPKITMQCMGKFYTKEQIMAENKKLGDANKAMFEKAKAEQAKNDAERQKKIAAAQAAFKKDMSAKGASTPIPAKPAGQPAVAPKN